MVLGEEVAGESSAALRWLSAGSPARWDREPAGGFAARRCGGAKTAPVPLAQRRPRRMSRAALGTRLWA